MAQPTVLIVDDLTAVHEMLEAVIAPNGFDVVFATGGEQALKLYKERRFEAVLVDIAMQPMDGLTVLRELKVIDPHAAVIMMTGYSSADNAMKALKFGAFDYVQKPFKLDELIKTLRRAVETRQKLLGDRERMLAEVSVNRQFDLADCLLGGSQAIRGVRNLLPKIIGASTPVLIQGEVGTGKRALAERIHANGIQAKGPFKAVDCALAKPAALKQSLLRDDGTAGPLFAEAAGGTLFLNHVEQLPKDVQEVLVTALALGTPSFRLVCASDANLEAEVDDPRLIDDFYFRISSLPILLPPLRERREDIPDLVDDVLKKAASPLFNESEVKFSDEAKAVFDAYPWPGNVAELSNVVCTVMAMAPGKTIGPESLPRRLKDLSTWPKLKDYLLQRERSYLKLLLRTCGNDKAKAAAVAGIKEFPPFL